MDSIQLALDVQLQKANQERQPAEELYPLLIAYYTWIRSINKAQNQHDKQEYNQQLHDEFKCLCQHNLLFFLTATAQFALIKKLFSTPSFSSKLHQFIEQDKEEQYKVKQIKLKRLVQLLHQQRDKLCPRSERKQAPTGNGLYHYLHYCTYFAHQSLAEKNEPPKTTLKQPVADAAVAGTQNSSHFPEDTNSAVHQSTRQRAAFFAPRTAKRQKEEHSLKSSLTFFRKCAASF